MSELQVAILSGAAVLVTGLVSTGFKLYFQKRWDVKTENARKEEQERARTEVLSGIKTHRFFEQLNQCLVRIRRTSYGDHCRTAMMRDALESFVVVMHASWMKFVDGDMMTSDDTSLHLILLQLNDECRSSWLDACCERNLPDAIVSVIDKWHEPFHGLLSNTIYHVTRHKNIQGVGPKVTEILELSRASMQLYLDCSELNLATVKPALDPAFEGAMYRGHRTRFSAFSGYKEAQFTKWVEFATDAAGFPHVLLADGTSTAPVLFASAGFVDAVGYSSSDLICSNCSIIQFDADGAMADNSVANRNLRIHMRENLSSDVMLRCFTRGGEAFDLNMHAFPVFDSSGKELMFHVMFPRVIAPSEVRSVDKIDRAMYHAFASALVSNAWSAYMCMTSTGRIGQCRFYDGASRRVLGIEGLASDGDVADMLDMNASTRSKLSAAFEGRRSVELTGTLRHGSVATWTLCIFRATHDEPGIEYHAIVRLSD
jgi:hypothetical protein